MNKILLIDGHSILNRAFYGVPVLSNSKGVHTNAVYGFINIMLKAIDDEKADAIAVAFDLKEPTFRHKMFEQYKGTRKPMPQELHEQVPIMKELLALMRIPVVTLSGYEADDILGTLAKRAQAANYEVSILSGDRDLLQLADEHIKIRMPKTIKGKTEIENYYPKDVVDKYEVTPSEFIDLKALMGDTSDNIPGVPGIGEKTATSIIKEYHSIEAAYESVDSLMPKKAANNLKEHYDLAQMSKILATIDINAPVQVDFKDMIIDSIYTEEAYKMCEELELKSLLARFASNVASVDTKLEYIILEDLVEVDDFFKKIKNYPRIGFSINYIDNAISGLAVASEAELTYIPVQGFVRDTMLTDFLHEYAKIGELIGIDIKLVLDFVDYGDNKRINDIALGAYLINPLKSTYTFEDISIEYMDEHFHFDKNNPIKNIVNSAYVAFNASMKIFDRIDELGMTSIYRDIEIPTMFVLRSMERIGMQVNKEALKAYGDSLTDRIDELVNCIYEQAGMEFNINSPKQLGEVLFDNLGLPCEKKTKSGYSTSADVLEKLAVDYPIVNDILEYRTLAKLKSTYADGLMEFIRPDGRIHSTFNQMVTATGRLSSTEPNLQNIPIRMEIGRQIRKVFTPKEGCVFVDADYSQIELRILAHMSADANLIEAYHSDSDIHRITASKVFNIPLDEVTSLQRSNAKAVNFGIVYGISSFGLSRDLSISKSEAKKYIDDYFKTYPGIKTFLDKLVADAKTNGYVTTIYGRRRPIPELSSSNFMQRGFGERIAMNSPLQGTAADIIKIAMINVYKRLEREQLQSRLILQIHDELLVEATASEVDRVKLILTEEMQNAAKLLVDLIVDVHTGNDWYEAK